MLVAVLKLFNTDRGRRYGKMLLSCLFSCKGKDLVIGIWSLETFFRNMYSGTCFGNKH